MAGTAEKVYTQGRIRVNSDGAREVYEALLAHVNFLLDARGTVPGVSEATRMLNRRVEHARRVLSELERVADERGWSLEDQDGEPERRQS